MADPTTLDGWTVVLGLVPVVVGAVLGFAAGVGGSWFNQRWQGEVDAKRRREQKYEELVSAVYEYEHWLDRLKGMRVFGNEGVETQTPLGKVFAITSVYFPQLTEQVEELDRVGLQYERWMIKMARRRLAGEIDTLDEGFDEAYGPCSKVRIHLLSSLGELARSGFK